MKKIAALVLTGLTFSSLSAMADPYHRDRGYERGSYRPAPSYRDDRYANGSRGIRPVLGIGYDFGGENVGTALFDDGSREDLEANQGIYFAAGISIPLQPALDLQTTIGYHTGSVDAPNGDMTWTSVPWETTLVAQLNQFSIGGGTVFQLNPKFESGGVLTDLGDFEFDDAMGFQVQAAWSPYQPQYAGNFSIGMKYTSINYELKDSNNTEIDGDTLGMFFNYKF